MNMALWMYSSTFNKGRLGSIGSDAENNVDQMLADDVITFCWHSLYNLYNAAMV